MQTFYKTSDTISNKEMIFACEILGYTITGNEDVRDIYLELMEKYVTYHELI